MKWNKTKHTDFEYRFTYYEERKCSTWLKIKKKLETYPPSDFINGHMFIYYYHNQWLLHLAGFCVQLLISAWIHLVLRCYWLFAYTYCTEECKCFTFFYCGYSFIIPCASHKTCHILLLCAVSIHSFQWKTVLFTLNVW